MSSRTGLIALCWVLTLAAAFAAGRLAAPGLGAFSGPVVAEGTESELRAALRERDLVARAASLARVLQNLDAASFPDASDVFEQSITDELDIELFASAWARVDGPGAWRRIDGWPANKRKAAIPAVCRAWAANDPEAARMVHAGLRGELRLECGIGIGISWPASEREELGRWIGTLSRSVERQPVISQTIAYQLKHEDAGAVISWVEALPEDGPEPVKAEALRRAAGQIAVEDPERAARWIESHREAPWAQDAARFVAEPWLPRDPEAAIAWVASLPEGEREEALNWMFRRWLTNDRNRAEEWLLAAEPSGIVAAAKEVAAKKIGYTEPLAGLQWCRWISAGKVRDRCLGQVARGWFLREPDAARRWVEESDLSAQAQKQVLRPAPDSRPAKRARRQLEKIRPARGDAPSEDVAPGATGPKPDNHP